MSLFSAGSRSGLAVVSSELLHRGHHADPRVPRACDAPIACRPPCACVDAILRSQTHPSASLSLDDFTISDFEVRNPLSSSALRFFAISCERVRTQFQSESPPPEIEKDLQVTVTYRNRACQFQVVSKASQFQIQASNSAFNFDSETNCHGFETQLRIRVSTSKMKSSYSISDFEFQLRIFVVCVVIYTRFRVSALTISVSRLKSP